MPPDTLERPFLFKVGDKINPIHLDSNTSVTPQVEYYEVVACTHPGDSYCFTGRPFGGPNDGRTAPFAVGSRSARWEWRPW